MRVNSVSNIQLVQHPILKRKGRPGEKLQSHTFIELYVLVQLFIRACLRCRFYNMLLVASLRLLYYLNPIE